jgi:hypothetical protein
VVREAGVVLVGVKAEVAETVSHPLSN